MRKTSAIVANVVIIEPVAVNEVISLEPEFAGQSYLPNQSASLIFVAPAFPEFEFYYAMN